MSDKITALERLKTRLIRLEYRGFLLEAGYTEFKDLLDAELMAERAKTHKEILTEAFQRCGIEFGNSSEAITLGESIYNEVTLIFDEETGKYKTLVASSDYR